MVSMCAKIGVVTVTYNSAEVLDAFMQCALSQHFSDFVLYVIDNASQDDTLKCLTSYTDSRLVIQANPENEGVAKGNNQGIERALRDGCSHVLLINNDTEFGPELIGEMLRQMNELSVPVLVPKMMFFEPRTTIWCAGGGFNRWTAFATIHYGEGEADEGQRDEVRQVDYTPTCCMLIRKDIFETVGLMDEKFFVYYDDTDFCLRLKKAGITICYCPYPVLYHKVSTLTGGAQSIFGVRFGTRNKVYFIRKHLSKPLKLPYLTAYYLFSVAKVLTGVDTLKMARVRHKAFFEGLRL